MQIDWKIKIGDILTSLTIIISVVALISSWSKDRNARETVQANLVRSTAASVIAKLDRWQALQLSLYDELQPEYVTTSEKLAEDFNVIKVRDYLWKIISAKRIQIYTKVLEEQISTSYFDLLAHFPDFRGEFSDLFRQLNEIEERNSTGFQEKTQNDVMQFQGKKVQYTSAMLGNALRSTAAFYKEQFRNQTSGAIAPIREFLFDVISKSNKQILEANRVTQPANSQAVSKQSP